MCGRIVFQLYFLASQLYSFSAVVASQSTLIYANTVKPCHMLVEPFLSRFGFGFGLR